MPLFPSDMSSNSFTDEVAALVIDIGTSSVRAGYAGDDTPKAIIPSYYGYIPVKEQDVLMGDGTEGSEQPPKAKLHLGSSGPSVWRSGMEVANPINDGISTVQPLFL